MSQPFVGEIRMAGFNFAPQSWAFCDGSTLSIAQNDVLFSLIGTTYGGDGQSTFNLPDLRGRLAIHQGSVQGTPFPIGQHAGSETVTLTSNQLPAHNHPALAQSAPGSQPGPAGALWAGSIQTPYSTNAPNATMNPQAIGLAGGNQPHENRMPYLAITFIIALFGVYPSQN